MQEEANIAGKLWVVAYQWDTAKAVGRPIKASRSNFLVVMAYCDSFSLVFGWP